jgi:hypothetical protein
MTTDDNGPWRLEAAKKRIAELEADNERLMREQDAVCRAIPDRFILDPPDGGTVYPEEAIQRMVADRAALATRVAEAVREACRSRIYSATYISAALGILDALDLGPIVAAALAKEGE